MKSNVKALGYAIVDASDLDAWVQFGSELFGLQVVERTEDRLLLRMDEYVYRIDIRRSELDGISALGWDVGTEASLKDLVVRLEAAGYQVEPSTPERAVARQVSEVVSFRDPDDKLDIELFWGMKSSSQRFVSPTGAKFVASRLGVGHAFQIVTDVAPYDALYREILGFRLSDHIDVPTGAVATFLHCNPRHHSFAYATASHRPLGIGHLMFEIDDIDLLGRKWDEVLDGAAPILSTMGKHSNDKMISFYVRSPSGFGIEFGTEGIQVDDEAWLPTRYDTAHLWGHRGPGDE